MTRPTVDLYSWQLEALAAWEGALRRGMIEAVTGTGKTHVAIGALVKLRAEDKRLSTLVVVPTIPLMNQWYERLTTTFPNERVGRIGAGFKDDYSILPVACVAVINSAVLKAETLLAHCRKGKNKSFLIADECHHYIDAPVFSRIRQFPFDYTLGLSATIFDYDVFGLGRIVYEYQFKDAYKDGIVPPFDLINVAVPLTSQERDTYLQLSEEIGSQLQKIRSLFDSELAGVPDHFFFNRLKQLMSQQGGDDPTIKRLFILLFKRAKVYYMAENKMRLAEKLTRLLVDQGRKKTVVFFERILSADIVAEDVAHSAASRLHRELNRDEAIWCRVYHSGLSKTERESCLSEFRKAGPSALLACRGLDEGVDIPDVDGAILAASTQSVRQRVQRIGRTLRKGDGKKRPIIVTLFAPGTNDSNVTSEDRATFQDVAKIHDETDRTCLGKVRQLL